MKEPTWEEDCLHWRGRLLTGEFHHWCHDWDDLPVDETCDEFACCGCFNGNPKARELKEEMQAKIDVREGFTTGETS